MNVDAKKLGEKPRLSCFFKAGITSWGLKRSHVPRRTCIVTTQGFPSRIGLKSHHVLGETFPTRAVGLSPIRFRFSFSAIPYLIKSSSGAVSSVKEMRWILLPNSVLRAFAMEDFQCGDARTSTVPLEV